VLLVLAVLVAIFTLLLLIWMYWLMFNVSLFAKNKTVPCDQPLSDWLLGVAVFGVVNLFLALVLPCFSPRPVLIGHGVLTAVGWLAFFIAGHIFVWRSKTCAQTSKDFVPNPQALMFSLYDTCWGLIIFFTVVLGLALCMLCCIVTLYASGAFDTSALQSDPISGAVVRGGISQLFFEAARARARSQASRPSPADYQPVPTDVPAVPTDPTKPVKSA